MKSTFEHSPAFNSLREKYDKILLTNSLTEEKRAHFLGEVRQAFNNGDLSVNELDLLYNRVSSESSELATIKQLDDKITEDKKEKFKEQLTKLITTDIQLDRIIEAVLRWTRDIGVSDWEIREDSIGVATRYLEQFFECNNTIKTVSPYAQHTVDAYVGQRKISLM